MARLRGRNIFYAFKINEDVRTHSFIEIKSLKEPGQSDGRQAYSAV